MSMKHIHVKTYQLLIKKINDVPACCNLDAEGIKNDELHHLDIIY